MRCHSQQTERTTKNTNKTNTNSMQLDRAKKKNKREKKTSVQGCAPKNHREHQHATHACVLLKVFIAGSFANAIPFKPKLQFCPTVSLELACAPYWTRASHIDYLTASKKKQRNGMTANNTRRRHRVTVNFTSCSSGLSAVSYFLFVDLVESSCARFWFSASVCYGCASFFVCVTHLREKKVLARVHIHTDAQVRVVCLQANDTFHATSVQCTLPSWVWYSLHCTCLFVHFGSRSRRRHRSLLQLPCGESVLLRSFASWTRWNVAIYVVTVVFDTCSWSCTCASVCYRCAWVWYSLQWAVKGKPPL